MTKDALDKVSKSTWFDKLGNTKLERLFAVAGLTCLAVFGPVKLYDWLTSAKADNETSAPSADRPPAIKTNFTLAPGNVDPGLLATATATRLPDDMPVVSWKDQGFGYSTRTRIFFKTDNFGKIEKVDVDQLGILSTTGQLHPIPKFALRYHAESSRGDVLMLASLNGPGKPVRLRFDGAADYVELMPNSDEFVGGKMDGKVARGMKSATTLTVVQGVSADGSELSFQYDLNELRQAIGLALAALGTTPSAR